MEAKTYEGGVKIVTIPPAETEAQGVSRELTWVSTRD